MLFCPSAENAVSCCLMHYIHVDVWDHDMLNRDDFMGRVVIPITTLTEEMLSGWFPLGRMTSKNNVSGEIYLEISLKATQVPSYCYMGYLLYVHSCPLFYFYLNWNRFVCFP